MAGYGFRLRSLSYDGQAGQPALRAADARLAPQQIEMQMLIVVQFEDVYSDQPERLPERAKHMEAHLAFLAKHSDLVVAAGALRPTADGTPTGGIWILNIESRPRPRRCTKATRSGWPGCASRCV